MSTEPNSIHGSGTRNGKSGEPWRGYDPTLVGRHWAIPRELVLAFGIDPGLSQHEKLDALYELGLIDLPESTGKGLPTYRQYLARSPGQLLQDIWAFQPYTKGRLHGTDAGIDEDIRWIPPRDKRERTGYPTQKPLALLERIIKASSAEGDMVLDPFCGCATACVAAENLGRRWVGIDISPKAVELVNMRLQQSMGDLFHNRLQPAPTSPGAQTSRLRCRTARTSTFRSASKKASAMGAAASFCSAISPLTTLSLNDGAAPTTSKIFNCSAATATASKVTGRRSTWWPGCGG